MAEIDGEASVGSGSVQPRREPQQLPGHLREGLAGSERVSDAWLRANLALASGDAGEVQSRIKHLTSVLEENLALAKRIGADR
jgi:hypothetical protein